MSEQDVLDFKETTLSLGEDIRELFNHYQNHVQWLERVWDGIPALIFFKDTNNIMIKVNEHTAKLIGRPKEEIEGKDLEELGWSSDVIYKYFSNDIDVIQNKKPKLHIIETLGNGPVKLSTNKYPIFNEYGEVIGILGISTQIEG